MDAHPSMTQPQNLQVPQSLEPFWVSCLYRSVCRCMHLPLAFLPWAGRGDGGKGGKGLGKPQMGVGGHRRQSEGFVHVYYIYIYAFVSVLVASPKAAVGGEGAGV